MKIRGFFKAIFTKINVQPAPEFIAQQLRQPSGWLAYRVARTMNDSNCFLYDLTLSQLDVKPGARLLEIGFGNGKFFDKIFARATNLKISGVDFSKQMVNFAGKYNKYYIQSGQLDIRLGTSENLPFKCNTFDSIVCINVIYFWEFPETHFKELWRVLKPGGKLYLGIRPKETLLQFTFTRFGFNLLETEQWIEIIAQNGFSIVDIITQNEPLTFRDTKEFTIKATCIVVKKIDNNSAEA